MAEIGIQAVLPVYDHSVFKSNCPLQVKRYHTVLTSFLTSTDKKKIQDVTRKQEVVTGMVINTFFVILRNHVVLKGKTTSV